MYSNCMFPAFRACRLVTCTFTCSNYACLLKSLLLAVEDCGTLNAPANGQASHTAGTTFGQTATYSCDVGYNLVGDSNRTCQATGRWSGNTPTCQGKLSLKPV